VVVRQVLLPELCVFHAQYKVCFPLFLLFFYLVRGVRLLFLQMIGERCRLFLNFYFFLLFRLYKYGREFLKLGEYIRLHFLLFPKAFHNMLLEM